MRFPTEPIDKKTLQYIIERDRILTQYDHAYGNGKPPKFERKSHVDTVLKLNPNKRKSNPYKQIDQ